MTAISGNTAVLTLTEVGEQFGSGRYNLASWLFLAAALSSACTATPPQGDEQVAAVTSRQEQVQVLWREQQKLLSSDTEIMGIGDQFGNAIALTDDTVMVGAPLDDVTFNEGAVFVFARTGDAWGEPIKLVASDPAGTDNFGWAIAVSGDRAVVGAYLKTIDAIDDHGAAYIFERDGDAWVEKQRLTSPGGVAGEQFGFAVALAGDTLLVGAPGEDVGANARQGAVYVFVRGTSEWAFQERLVVADGLAQARFGSAVAVNAELPDIAFIGGQSGSAAVGLGASPGYVFRRSGTSWTMQQKLEQAADETVCRFGRAAAFSGDTLLLGCPGTVVETVDERGAYVFVRQGQDWIEQARLVASDAAPARNFGASVALLGDVALVGAPFDEPASTGNDEQGSVYVFDRMGGDWTERQKLTAADGDFGDHFGQTVALAPALALIGAPLDVVDMVDALPFGSVYVFEDGFLPNGAACTANAECFTDYCVDGVCCDTACDAQCEACAEAGQEGTCVVVAGAPRGERPACPASDDEVCATQLCDGTHATSCVAFVGEETTCRVAACEAGEATLAAVCDGEGSCPEIAQEDCGRYACDGDQCGMTCGSEGDCAEGFRCEDDECVPKQESVCSGDGSSQIDADGKEISCAPYICHDGACLAICEVSTECTSGYVCDSVARRCEPNDSKASNEVAGCGCAVADASRSKPWPAALLIATLLLALGWRRRPRLMLAGLLGALGGCTERNLESERAVTRLAQAVDGVGLWRENQILEPPDVLNPVFGVAVALDGDVAAVSGRTSSTSVGVVTIYRYLEGRWTVEQELGSPDVDVGDFGQMLAVSGETLVASAIIEPNGVNRGTVYVFERKGTSWEQQARFDASGATDSPYGGIQLRGDRLLVGAPEETIGANLAQGTAQVFRRDAGGWVLEQQLIDAAGQRLDQLGVLVALSDAGDLALLSGPGAEGNIKMFQRSGTTWSQMPLAAGAFVATSIADAAFSGDTLLMSTSEAVHFFVRSGAEWLLEATVQDPESDILGYNAALFGDTALLSGASAANNRDPGRVHVLRRDAQGWVETQELTIDPAEASANFGSAIALGDGKALVGAPGEADTGRVRFYEDGYLARGETCASADDCVTGHCADGLCCDAACDGQCEACAEPDYPGQCRPVVGEPRGEREGCASDDQDPCAQQLCDGIEPTMCAAFVGSEVSCREAVCEDGMATSAAQCRAGACPEPVVVSCGSFACTADACAEAPCESDDDCAGDFECRSGDCVSRPVAVCSEDGLSEITEAGEESSCDPYVCVGGACLDECTDSTDCVAGFFCSEHACRESQSEAGGDAGCGCRLGQGSGTPAFGWLALICGALAWRRRAASSPARAPA